jgi:toxin ParE1/3/4
LLRYSYHRLAADELHEAITRYRIKKQEPERAARFFASVERAVTHIRTHPEAAPVEHPAGVRVKPLDRFEYAIHYTLLEGSIRILAVAHQKRRPFYWTRLLRKP